MNSLYDELEMFTTKQYTRYQFEAIHLKTVELSLNIVSEPNNSNYSAHT